MEFKWNNKKNLKLKLDEWIELQQHKQTQYVKARRQWN